MTPMTDARYNDLVNAHAALAPEDSIAKELIGEVHRLKCALSDRDRDRDADLMTLRDHFAGQALAGLVGTMDTVERDLVTDEVRGGRLFAEAAYMYADAMLKVRERGN